VRYQAWFCWPPGRRRAGGRVGELCRYSRRPQLHPLGSLWATFPQLAARRNNLSGQSSSATRVVVGAIPGPLVAWQDRVELLDRLRTMADGGRRAAVTILTGQPGSGKTQIAAAYARACFNEGWPVVVWMNGETGAGIVSGLDALAAEAGIRPPDVEPEDVAVSAQLIRFWRGSCGAAAREGSGVKQDSLSLDPWTGR